MKIDKTANVILASLWLASISFAIIWVANIPFKYEAEPITVILSLVSFAVTTLITWYSAELAKEKFSVANVLANGYINNFLEPVITQLIKNSEINKKPIIYIFIPELVTDMTGKSIDRFIAKLNSKGLLHNTIQIQLDEGRGIRDLMTLTNSKSENVYFDFPNTIYSLTDYIEYKINSPKDSLNIQQRNKLGKEYIARFKQQLIDTLSEKKLYPDYIKFTDCTLEINC